MPNDGRDAFRMPGIRPAAGVPGLSVRVCVCFRGIVPAPAHVEVEPCEGEERRGDKDVEQGQLPAFGREIRFGKLHGAQAGQRGYVGE